MVYKRHEPQNEITPVPKDATSCSRYLVDTKATRKSTRVFYKRIPYVHYYKLTCRFERLKYIRRFERLIPFQATTKGDGCDLGLMNMERKQNLIKNIQGKTTLIEGFGVRLRPLARRDLLKTLSWRNRDDIRKWFFYSSILTLEQHYDWFANYIVKDDDIVYIIEECVELHQPVGQIALYKIDWLAKRAEYGRLMTGENSARGRGIAKRSTRLLLHHAHTNLGLQEIFLEVIEDNKAAIAVYEACGFIKEELRDGIIKMLWTPSSQIAWNS